MKRSKKNSDEERSRKKKKPKSGKRRRRVSSSPSSYSSDSEDTDPRARRRSRRSKKPEKRRKESKNTDRRKSRKTAKAIRRGVSLSSSRSYSSRSCSTCRGRSSSPVSSVSERQRQRQRRPQRSRSPSVRLERKWKSRARSGSRGRERGRSRHRASDDGDGSRYPSRSCSPCGGSRRSSPASASPVRDRCTSKDTIKQIEQPRLLRKEMTEEKKSKTTEKRISVTNEDRGTIKRVYDEIPSSRKDEGLRRKNTEEKRNNVKTTGYEHGEYEEGEAILSKAGKQSSKNADIIAVDISNNKIESVDIACDLEKDDDLESQLRKRALENLRKFRAGPSVNTSLADDVQKGSSQTKCQDDPPEVLEARQRTLDHFIGSQGGLSANTRSKISREKESSQTYSYNSTPGNVDAQEADKSLDLKYTASLEHGSIQGENQQKPRLRSVVLIPEEKVTTSQDMSNQNYGDVSGASNSYCPDNVIDSQTTSNKVSMREESTNKMVLPEITSMEKEKQDARAFEAIGCSTTLNTEVNKVHDESVPRASTLNSESGNSCKKEDAGSQFQQKTFSRVHDGELVQVSYKVYIPQKSPALARRKLQR